MVSQLLDRLFSKDRCRYPISYGKVRESLSIGGREGMRFLFFVTDQKIATVLTACLRREIDIPTVYNSFLEYKRELIRSRKWAISTPVLFTKEQMVSYVQDSINEMPAAPLFLLVQAYEDGIE
ncbi:MAG TPA: hypothetical protein VJ720_07900, partial [Chitinophaga sp.]|nr:hypothetical protein [Chitinophaga sp.]